jgi:hypothetical protein
MASIDFSQSVLFLQRGAQSDNAILRDCSFILVASCHRQSLSPNTGLQNPSSFSKEMTPHIRHLTKATPASAMPPKHSISLPKEYSRRFSNLQHPKLVRIIVWLGAVDEPFPAVHAKHPYLPILPVDHA